MWRHPVWQSAAGPSSVVDCDGRQRFSGLAKKKKSQFKIFFDQNGTGLISQNSNLHRYLRCDDTCFNPSFQPLANREAKKPLFVAPWLNAVIPTSSIYTLMSKLVQCWLFFLVPDLVKTNFEFCLVPSKTYVFLAKTVFFRAKKHWKHGHSHGTLYFG